MMPNTESVLPSDVKNILNASDITAFMAGKNAICISDKRTDESGCMIDLHSLTSYEQTAKMLELHLSTGQVVCFILCPADEADTPKSITEEETEEYIADAYSKAFKALVEDLRADNTTLPGVDIRERFVVFGYRMYRAGFYYGVDTALIAEHESKQAHKKTESEKFHSQSRTQSNEHITVGQRIADYLDEIQMSTFTLSHFTGIPRKNLDAMLANERKLKIEPYQKICWALRVDTDKFINPTPPYTRKEIATPITANNL
jgi:hypothetical protein